MIHLNQVPSMMLRRFAPLVGAMLLVAACAAEVVAPTFGEGCEAGALRAGEYKVGALHEGSCTQPHHFYSEATSPYVAYSVHLEQGKAYFFKQEKQPDPAREDRNGLDAILTLYGRTTGGASIPLAVSDDNGYGRNSEFFFIAPKTGDYQLVASSYYGIDDVDALGGFRVSMQECPIVARFAASDTLDVTLEPSPCRRSEAGLIAGFEDAPADYRFVSIKVQPNEDIAVRVNSHEVIPAWELFARWDTYGNLDRSAAYHRNNSSEVIINTGSEGGYLTLAIGTLGSAPSAPTMEVSVRRPEMMAWQQ